MFKGIIQELGVIKKIEEKNGKIFHVAAHLATKTKIGNSISINGVCTTVIKRTSTRFSFYVSQETLAITNLQHLGLNDKVNLELAFRIGETMDGHFLSGHVDKMVQVKEIIPKVSSHIFSLKLRDSDKTYLIPKGSVAINGISLTVYKIQNNLFQIMVIPLTWQKTNLQFLTAHDWVNIEFDLLGKYVKNIFENRKYSSS